MLLSVQCDKFISNGDVRPPIIFHPGLNAVLGDDNGSNSIGKSTFLMILDFVFGGSDYVNKCIDVQENVKGHTIMFSFKFGDEVYYFSRNTVDYAYVSMCDETYTPLPGKEKIPLKNYTDFLAQKYNLTKDGLTWRSAVSRFIRVYKRDTLDEMRPLRSAKDEKTADTVKRYIQLHGKYSAVDMLIKQAADAEDEKQAFQKSLKYNQIRGAHTKKEFDENAARIKELEEEEHRLAEESSQGLLDLDSVQARRLSLIRDRIAEYRRQRARVQNQLNMLRTEMVTGKKNFRATIDELSRFFPDVDFRHIEEIEAFHRNLSQLLDEDYRSEEKKLATAYVMLGNEIVRLKAELEKVEKIPNVTEAILKEYAAIATELNNLEEANRNYEEFARLQKVASDYAATRDKAIHEVLFSIEIDVDSKMRDINTQLLHDDKHLPPMIRMESLSQYTFNTPNDGGTGAQYRGVITFDLANLALGLIPLCVHDSLMLKNIEKKVVSEIVDLYIATANAGQQVFMAFDALDSYSPKTRKALEDNAVLVLSPGGNELFGWAWNKETVASDSDEQTEGD